MLGDLELINFYGSATNHLELGIWVGWSVGFNANFNTSTLSKRPSLELLDSLTRQVYSHSQCTGRQPLMEEDLWWKTMEDNLWRKTTFDGSRPLTEDEI